MGHSQDARQSKNQSETGALDTVEDKTIDQEPTEESEEPEEVEESTETEQVEEELAEETAPAEEEKEEEEVEAEKAPEEEAETLALEEEEEEKKEKREKAPEEEEIVEERIYTIPLRRAWIAPRKKRAPRAVRIVRGFIQRHMKIETVPKGEEEEEEGRLVISNEVNEKLWSHGIEKPPRNIRVRAVKDKEGVVTLYLAEGD
jgi:large subunit ribosomal protein L31e